MTKIVATAEQFYVDPSALLKLYLHEPESRAMAEWRASVTEPVRVSLHGRLELANALCLAVHRGMLGAAARDQALAFLDEDFEQGRLVLTDVPWRSVMERAESLSRRFSSRHGTRTLDVLHVAAALELACTCLVTYDARQSELARQASLAVLAPAR